MFSIKPELCVAMLIAPRMLDEESIHIAGAEQFSAYSGYGSDLRYVGDYQDSSRRDLRTGSLLRKIVAMDAVDYRRYAQESDILGAQLVLGTLCREVEKAAAAFQPSAPREVRSRRAVATGNWGSGVFQGDAHLKALIQWMAASQAGRRMLYFPYESPALGRDLTELSKAMVNRGVCVGDLWYEVSHLSERRDEIGVGNSKIFDLLHDILHGRVKSSKQILQEQVGSKNMRVLDEAK